MRDAFGVVKSFSTAIKGPVKFKPISEMSAAERAGIKGYHRKAQGVTPRDAALRDKLQPQWTAMRRYAQQIDDGIKAQGMPTDGKVKTATGTGRIAIKENKSGGRIIHTHKDAPKDAQQAASFPLPPKRGQSQRQADSVVITEGKEGSKRLAVQTGHEMRHVTRRKKASAAVRLKRDPVKLMGDEGRADAFNPKYSSDWSTYNAAAFWGDKRAIKTLKRDKTYSDGAGPEGLASYRRAFHGASGGYNPYG